jgi:hypothetical protein
MILMGAWLILNSALDVAHAAPVRNSFQKTIPTAASTPVALPSPSPTPIARSTNSKEYGDFTQLPRDRKLPIDTVKYQLPSGKTDWKEFWSNVHGSYGLSFMGPRIAGSGKETYNLYIPDVAPLQLAHTWRLGAQVNPDLQLGFSQFAIQNVSESVMGTTGTIRSRSFEAYDPEIYVNLPNLVKVDGWFVFTSARMSIPLTDASKNKGKITQITIDQNWSTSNTGDWSFGVSGEIQPIFYTDPKPANLTDRKTLFASIGHLISYRISPSVNIQSTSTFDLDHRSPDPNGPLNFTSNLDDFSRISLYMSPSMSKSFFVTMGGYFQFLVWRPGMETSILGMDFSISF